MASVSVLVRKAFREPIGGLATEASAPKTRVEIVLKCGGYTWLGLYLLSSGLPEAHDYIFTLLTIPLFYIFIYDTI